MKILPVLLSDSYKQFHFQMYPKGMTKLYSNMTPRSYKHMETPLSVFFGLQYYIKEYLIKQWNEGFFHRPKDEVVKEYKRFHKGFSFVPDMDTAHIEKLHDLGYLPILIKALPEGTLVPEKVPYFTITNTHPDFAWLVNFLETQMSTVLWDFCVNATIAWKYRELLQREAEKSGDVAFVDWQGHDFSMRGRSSIESTLNQAGHLLSFKGTDTIPAVLFLEKYYGANIDNELVGSSVPASEHSIMTAYGKEDEIVGFERILDQFPAGIVSVVSDSFDLWKVCTEYVTTLKDKILARDGKLVIRPDSGDPVEIICGKEIIECNSLQEAKCMFWDNIRDMALREPLYRVERSVYKAFYDGWGDVRIEPYELTNQDRGVVELLWNVFGGTGNDKGFKVLDSHIGVIYGDSITYERASEICRRLQAKRFASTNVVLGIGSYTYNYNTRDTLGLAVKSTYCEITEGDTVIQREIFKDPVTDSGIKKSAKGLLRVEEEDGRLVLKDQVSHEEEAGGLLTTVFEDGKLTREVTLTEIRTTLWG